MECFLSSLSSLLLPFLANACSYAFHIWPLNGQPGRRVEVPLLLYDFLNMSRWCFIGLPPACLPSCLPARLPALVCPGLLWPAWPGLLWPALAWPALACPGLPAWPALAWPPARLPCPGLPACPPACPPALVCPPGLPWPAPARPPSPQNLLLAQMQNSSIHVTPLVPIARKSWLPYATFLSNMSRLVNAFRSTAIYRTSKLTYRAPLCLG